MFSSGKKWSFEPIGNSPQTTCLTAYTLTYGLIERTSSMLDEIALKTVHKDKDGDQLRKKKQDNK